MEIESLNPPRFTPEELEKDPYLPTSKKTAIAFTYGKDAFIAEAVLGDKALVKGTSEWRSYDYIALFDKKLSI